MQLAKLLAKIRALVLLISDISIYALAVVAAAIAKLQWTFGPRNLPLSFRVWNSFGIAPVPFHYYHPAFNPDALPETVWASESALPGVDLRIDCQLELMEQFHYVDEIKEFPLDGNPDSGYHFHNRMFGAGDAEMLYSIIRHSKPRRLIEIGSGYSTLMAKSALDRNRAEGYVSEHICIEPYPPSWLEKVKLGNLIQEPVEKVDISVFEKLEANDILFIDSSHVLRTGGDVQFEYLELLPRLKPGVFVHIHDVFLPFEYPISWVREKKWFWTEQYLLQAFLAFNSEFEVVLALSYLHAHHRARRWQKSPRY
jgi:Methyltransferase domain